MQDSSNNENGSRNNQLEERQQRRSGTLLNLDILNCPICKEPLTVPIFQCDDGHVACHSCCSKLKNKCSECSLPSGKKRSKVMESVVEAVIIPCRNSEFGCAKNVPYGKQSSHEMEHCTAFKCSCPTCNFVASYKDISDHYIDNHLESLNGCFTFGETIKVEMLISDKIYVLTAFETALLFVVQCFEEPSGVYVTVNCIAPILAPDVGKFSYRISYSFNGKIHTHQVSEMDKILEVSSDIIEEKKIMFISNSLLRGDVFEFEVCISEVESINV